MKMTLIVLLTVMVVCVASLSKSAAVYGVHGSRSKEELTDDVPGGPWWLAALVKRSSRHAAAPDKKRYYFLPRQVTYICLLYLV